MRFRFGVALTAAAVIAAGGCAASGGSSGGAEAAAPAAGGRVVADGVPPRDNMFTRSAGLYLQQGQQNPNPEERRQRFQEALEASLNGINTEPGNPKSFFQAGQAYMGLGDLAGADSMFTKAETMYPAYFIDIDPVREQQWVQNYNQAIGQLQGGNTARAIELFERANLIYRGRPEALLNLGSAYAGVGENEKAIQAYRDALAIMRGPEREEQNAESLANWDENVEIATFNMAQLLAGEGRNEEAADAYTTYLEGDPDNVTAISNLAVVMVNLERPDSAMALYTRLLERPDLDGRDYFVTGVGLFQSENYELAAQAFSKAVELNPNNRDAVYNLAQTLFLAENYAELLPVARSLVELDAYNENVYRILAQALVQAGDEQEAVRVLERMQALPIEVRRTQLAPRGGGGGAVAGELLNHTLEPGQVVKLTIYFQSVDGTVEEPVEVNVTVPAQDAMEPFRAELDSEMAVGSYRYTVELPAS